MDRGKTLEKFKGIAMEVHRRANAIEAMVERSKEVLSKAEVDLAIARADLATMRGDLALEKQRREAEVIEAKRELANMEKRVEEAVVKYKTFKDFITRMA